MRSVDNQTIEAAMRPDEIIVLLREQRSLYAQLASVAARQRSLITSDATSTLLSLLEGRQELVRSLSRLTERLEPVRKRWEEHKRQFNHEQRAEAESLITDIRRQMGSVLAQDEEDARLLAARKEATAQSLRGAHATANALAAYRAPAGNARRLDTHDEVSS